MSELHEEPLEGEEGRRGKLGSSNRKRLLGDLMGRWYWVCLGIIIGLSASLYYLSKARPLYSANATLLVKHATFSVLDKSQTGEVDMRSVEAMNTVVERLKRPSLLNRVAARTDVTSLEGLNPKPVRWLPDWMSGAVDDGLEVGRALPSTGASAGMIATWMKVSVRRGTRLVDIVMTHPSPQAAAVIADAVAMEYIAEISTTRSSGRASSIEVLSTESEKTRFSLQGAQNAFTCYVRAMDSHAGLEAKEKELAELSRRYLSKHPRMITCKGQIATLQARFLADFDTAVKFGADQAYWKQSGIKLDPDSRSMEERLDIARRLLLARTAVLKSEIQSQELVFNAILTKMRETGIDQASTDSEVEISSHAVVPSASFPVSPVGNRVIIVGLAGGVCFGLSLAYLSVLSNNKFHTVMELEDVTGIPALGVICQVPFRALANLLDSEREKSQEHETAWSPGVLFRKALYGTTFAEMIRVVRASVTLLGPEGGRKVTLFTSSIPGEGKTFTAVNFALASAAEGKRVLLMDFDLRKPSVHNYFGIRLDSDSLGMSGYLAGLGTMREAIVPTGVAPGLDVMAGGMRLPNPGDLLNEENLYRIMDEAKADYDVIVIDTSPLLAVPDARLLARFADNICFVVRAAFVPKPAVLRAISLIESGSIRISGLVFNGYYQPRRLTGAKYSYSYYQYGMGGVGGRRSYGGYGGYGGYGADGNNTRPPGGGGRE